MERQNSRLGAAFWRLWLGVATSNLADGIVMVAFPLLALSLTRKPILVAGVAVAAQLPGFLVNPFSGALVDRSDRRRLAMIAEGGRLVVFVPFAAAVVAGHDSLLLLYSVVTIIGCCDSLFTACTGSSTPDVVADRQLEQANGRLGAAEICGRELLGQSAGGALYAVARALPFGVDVVCFGISAAMAASSIPETAGKPARRPVVAEIVEGIRWFLRSAELLQLAAVISLFAVCNGAVQGVLVLYATGPLHVGRAGFGLMMAGASVGGLAASLVAGRVAALVGAVRTVMLGGLVAGCSYLVLAYTTSPVLAGVLVSLEAAGLLVGNVASLSLRQRLVPDELRGRIITTFRMLLTAGYLLGAIGGGVVTAALGLATCFAGAGVLQLSTVVVAGATLISRRAAAQRASGALSGGVEVLTSRTPAVAALSPPVPVASTPDDCEIIERFCALRNWLSADPKSEDDLLADALARGDRLREAIVALRQRAPSLSGVGSEAA